MHSQKQQSAANNRGVVGARLLSNPDADASGNFRYARKKSYALVKDFLRFAAGPMVLHVIDKAVR